MANQRAADQVFVGIWLSSSLAGRLDVQRGGVGRSQFVRDALADYLGIPNSPEKNAPDRAKKPLPLSGLELNEAANSKKIDAAVVAGGKKVSYMGRKPRKSPHV